MDEYEAELQAILSCQKQKRQQLDGFLNATLEMDTLADNDDPTSFGICVDMREKQIERISQIDEEIEHVLAKLPKETAMAVRSVMAKEGTVVPQGDKLLKSIHEANTHNRELGRRIVEADRALNEKLGNAAPYGEK